MGSLYNVQQFFIFGSFFGNLSKILLPEDFVDAIGGLPIATNSTYVEVEETHRNAGRVIRCIEQAFAKPVVAVAV